MYSENVFRYLQARLGIGIYKGAQSSINQFINRPIGRDCQSSKLAGDSTAAEATLTAQSSSWIQGE